MPAHVHVANGRSDGIHGGETFSLKLKWEEALINDPDGAGIIGSLPNGAVVSACDFHERRVQSSLKVLPLLYKSSAVPTHLLNTRARG